MFASAFDLQNTISRERLCTRCMAGNWVKNCRVLWSLQDVRLILNQSSARSEPRKPALRPSGPLPFPPEGKVRGLLVYSCCKTLDTNKVKTRMCVTCLHACEGRPWSLAGSSHHAPGQAQVSHLTRGNVFIDRSTDTGSEEPSALRSWWSPR